MLEDLDQPPAVSRRDLLKRAGGAAVAAAVPIDVLGQAAPAREPLETLSETEATTLDAIVARLIPADANGPGAAAAGAVRYIDRAFGGALAASREAYRAGLATIDAYARSSRGAPFAQLSPQNQDAILGDLERNGVPGLPDTALFLIYSDRRPIAAASMSTFGRAPRWGSAWKAFIRQNADSWNTAYLQKTTLTAQALAWRTADHLARNWAGIA